MRRRLDWPPLARPAWPTVSPSTRSCHAIAATTCSRRRRRRARAPSWPTAGRVTESTVRARPPRARRPSPLAIALGRGAVDVIAGARSGQRGAPARSGTAWCRTPSPAARVSGGSWGTAALGVSDLALHEHVAGRSEATEPLHTHLREPVWVAASLSTSRPTVSQSCPTRTTKHGAPTSAVWRRGHGATSDQQVIHRGDSVDAHRDAVEGSPWQRQPSTAGSVNADDPRSAALDDHTTDPGSRPGAHRRRPSPLVFRHPPPRSAPAPAPCWARSKTPRGGVNHGNALQRTGSLSGTPWNRRDLYQPAEAGAPTSAVRGC